MEKTFDKINYAKLVRRIFLVLFDIIFINLSSFLALFIRLEFDLVALEESGFVISLLKCAPFNTVLTFVLFMLFGLYNSLWEFAGIYEFQRIASASALSGVLQFCLMKILNLGIPRSFPVIYIFLLCFFTAALRFSYRFIRRETSAVRRASRKKTMLIGAGDAGAQVIREFQNSDHSSNRVVCIIDDDRSKQDRRMFGVPIVGGRDKIVKAAEKYGVEEIIIAIPSISHESKREIVEICSHTSCKIKQLPGLYQIANGEVSIKQIRDVDIEDLLEREVVRVDIDMIAEYVKGKTVLVTGVGSIESELARQLAAHSPKKLVLFDIYENNAYAIQQELIAKRPELPLEVLIGSVRDYARIESVMNEYKPDIVYHAAAHKHVPLMEESPLEAVKNNVFGTLNTARAASAAGVGRFILISSDKAVNPTNVMGATKRICEMIVQMMDEKSRTSFAAVRFGNVLGSNGSVIPLFRRQIKEGGPVTVTHPDINRYFMTIPEAVSLVLQAGAYANGGEIFVLDMGKPVRINDLAKNMIRLSGFEPDVDIKIVYTGLRPGEKLFEEILMDEEGMRKTQNNLIYIGRKLDFDEETFKHHLELLGSFEEGDAQKLRSLIKETVPTYNPAGK